ncbi:MAG: hypothetical protein ACT4R6_04985, partial [Gemmatimonadaceae bacterium]
MRLRDFATLLFVAFATVSACNDDPVSPSRVAHEVWLVDQSNSPGLSYGGAIHIFEDTALAGGAASPSAASVIDLGQATSSMCMAA